LTTKKETTAAIGSNSREALRAFIERIERLETEKRESLDDIREVYKEIKDSGFDVKAMRKIVAMRKRAHSELTEEQAVIELYLSAVGVW
jgi:uncharacterized protein (UPF0335 family)